MIALFQREFVKPGLIDAEVSRGLPRSFETRLEVDDGDYAEVTPSVSAPRQWRSSTRVRVC